MFLKGGARRRRDSNEKSIVAALEAAGAEIFYISGRGLPDLLVRFRGRWTPLEVKTAKGRMKNTQVDALGEAQFPVVRSPEDALRQIGALR